MLVIYTDGASSGNPGPMGIGVAIFKDNRLVKEISEPIGEGTNNTAEYTAVLRALETAIKMGETDIRIRCDSELLVKQLNGLYKVRQQHLRKLKRKIMELSKGLEVTFEHVPREENNLADKLSKIAVKGSK